MQYQSKKIGWIIGYTNRHFGDLYGGDTTGKQTPSGYKEQNTDLKLKWQVANNLVLTAAYQFVHQSNVSLYHRVKLENFNYYFYDPQQRQMAYVKLEMKNTSKFFKTINFTSSLQKSLEKRKYHKNGNSNQFLEEDKVSTIGVTAEVLSVLGKNWTANSGIEFFYDKVNSVKQQITIANTVIFNQRGLYPNNASNSNLSFYSLHHLNLKSFDIELGLRYNSLEVYIPDTTTSSFKLGNITVKPSSFVGNLALVYHFNKQQSLYSSFSTGYRAPNIDDMGTLGLVDFRYEVPSYNLNPEKTNNSEIGYRFSNKKINASVAFFYMHLNNLITRIKVEGEQVSGYQVYTKANSSQSFISGFEASFNYQFSPALTIQSGLAYTYGQNLSTNEPMRRIPPFNGRVLLKYNKKNWQFISENIFAANQNRLAAADKADNRINPSGTPEWNVMNLFLNYQLYMFTIRLAFQNILNKDYRTHGSGINGMGRSIVLKLQINL